jgi:triosephosphate isomerase
MSSRTPLIAGNWKMHKTGLQAVEAASRLKRVWSTGIGRGGIMIAPTYTPFTRWPRRSKAAISPWGAEPALGETGRIHRRISSEMLVDAGCSHVIVGHSERRQFFGETDATVNRKIRAALASRPVPVFCIGESEAEREAGETFSVLDKQVRVGLKDFVSDDLSGLVIAYEPVWAIGTGKTASREQAQEAHQFIRSLLNTLFGKPFASGVRILYGGSVKPDNVRSLMEMPDVDGALVGGASLDPETFSKLVFFNN